MELRLLPATPDDGLHPSVKDYEKPIIERQLARLLTPQMELLI